MEDDVGRLVEERPPEVVVALHPERHLNEGTLPVDPTGGAEQARLGNLALEHQRHARLRADTKHLGFERFGILSSYGADFAAAGDETVGVERRQVQASRLFLAKHEPA